MKLLGIVLLMILNPISLEARSSDLRGEARSSDLRGAINGAGGSILKGYFLERGELILSHLSDSQNGQEIKNSFDLNYTKLALGLREENIIITSEDLEDRHNSEVDALINNDKIYLNETSISDFLFLGFNLDHLVFHELLRLGGYNDDGRRISKNLKYTEGFEPQSFLAYRNSHENDEPSSPPPPPTSNAMYQCIQVVAGVRLEGEVRISEREAKRSIKKVCEQVEKVLDNQYLGKGIQQVFSCNYSVFCKEL